MTALTAVRSVPNYLARMDMSDYLIETPLFPREVLESYTAWNLEQDVTEAERQHFNGERGGGQGDYRDGMGRKLVNVVDCLTRFPASKRAVVTVSNEASPSHEDDAAAKCMRELHLHLDDDGRLSGTVLFRAQAALIFPKNIHFIGALMTEVAARLPGSPPLGELFYLTSVLVADRA